MQDMQESLANTETKETLEQETRTTIDLPETLLRRAKAAAAMEGETFKRFTATALEERVERLSNVGGK